MGNKFFLLIATILGVLPIGSCEDDSDVVSPSTAKQLDMTVVVPIHPSSLEYFDYIIRYMDNRGIEYNDTIQQSGGEVAEDYSNVRPKQASLTDNKCYVRTFSYDNLFVTCSVTVELLPKKGNTEIGDFFFYKPKPYIFPHVSGSTPKDMNTADTFIDVMNGVECIYIDTMTYETFESTYGRVFSSRCSVYQDLEKGYETFFD